MGSMQYGLAFIPVCVLTFLHTTMLMSLQALFTGRLLDLG